MGKRSLQQVGTIDRAAGIQLFADNEDMPAIRDKFTDGSLETQLQLGE